MTERLAHDIAEDLRQWAVWPLIGSRLGPLLFEAADKLDNLIEDLAKAENARDEALAAAAAWARALAAARGAIKTMETYEQIFAARETNYQEK